VILDLWQRSYGGCVANTGERPILNEVRCGPERQDRRRLRKCNVSATLLFQVVGNVLRARFLHRICYDEANDRSHRESRTEKNPFRCEMTAKPAAFRRRSRVLLARAPVARRLVDIVVVRNDEDSRRAGVVPG